MYRKILKLLPLAVLVLVAVLMTSSSAVAAPATDNAPVVPGEVIVSLVSGADAADVAADHGATVLRDIANSRFVLFGVATGAERSAAGALNADARVEFAEPNFLRQLHDAPDDDGYGLKWDLHNDGSLCDGSDCATADADMDWQEAYTSLGSAFNGSAVVAVVDTGIDFSHPDLDAKITTNGYDFLDGDSDPTDTYGHGTHVAGIALAETNNGAEVDESTTTPTEDDDGDTAGVGYSPSIQVMPLRVCGSNGCPTSAIVDAIYHAADNGANVINLSLGGRFGSSSEEQAINYAWDKGLVIAASSGNDGSGKVSYPAAFANAIAVGATNWHDQLAPYSNKGNDLDVTAPGGDMDHYDDPGGIYSTMPTYDVYLTTSYEYDKYYDQLQGTSMSAPQVSGLAALLFAQDPTRSNSVVRDIIECTADDLGKPGWDREYGWGRINVCKAVGGTECDGPVDNPPSVSIMNPVDGATVSGTVSVTADASDDNGVSQVEFFVDGGSIGADTTVPYEISWDSSTVSDGGHTITATATDTGGQTASDSVSVIVDNEPSAGVTVDSISPNTMQAGTTVDVTISGLGFVSGADVTFENGSGPAPTASNVVVVDANTITATVTAKSGGPPRNRVWNVRVTNPDGSSDVLVDGFTVTP